ncbi:hypothetical protein bcere0020_56190 [Bacillus cereus Rock3-29]|nr:hypothetical protein bcere0006_53490 [Bacillus wiedmannii]EEL31226.1 hypothetical protein bcere0019_56390 [Bacillus cereus Rock3-28]EEL36991.1 hypothetical protein bcere0020_56190 [Bacillus cereus Rock3-29]
MEVHRKTVEKYIYFTEWSRTKLREKMRQVEVRIREFCYL